MRDRASESSCLDGGCVLSSRPEGRARICYKAWSIGEKVDEQVVHVTCQSTFLWSFFKLLFSNIFTLVSLHFLPFMIYDTHQDQNKDNIFHCIYEYKTKQLILSMNLHCSYQSQSPPHC